MKRNSAETKSESNHLWSGACLSCFFGGWLSASFAAVAFASGNDTSTEKMNFETSITIILSALAVMLTILTLILAVVGVLGLTALRKAAFDAGLKHATEQMAEGGELREIILARTDENMAKFNMSRRSEEEWGNPEKEYGA